MPNPTLKPSPQLLELLVCPVSKTPLTYDEQSNELISITAGLAYPVDDGIPMLLPELARKISQTQPVTMKELA